MPKLSTVLQRSEIGTRIDRNNQSRPQKINRPSGGIVESRWRQSTGELPGDGESFPFEIMQETVKFFKVKVDWIGDETTEFDFIFQIDDEDVGNNFTHEDVKVEGDDFLTFFFEEPFIYSEEKRLALKVNSSTNVEKLLVRLIGIEI